MPLNTTTLPQSPLKVASLPKQQSLSVAKLPQQQIASVGSVDNQKSSPPTATILTDDNRSKLNEVVHKMTMAGEPEEAIQTAVNQFKSKYAQSGVFQKEPEGEKGGKGLALGATKGGFSTLNNLSNLGQSVLSQTAGRFANLVTGKGFTPTEKKLIPKENLEAHGTAEKIGKTGEQIAEFFIPGGAVSKVNKTLAGGVESLNLASKLGKAGKVAEGGLKLLGKSLVGATEAGGVTALQGGDKEQVKSAAKTGAIFAPLAEGVSTLLKKAPKTAWSTLLKRTSTEAGKKPLLPAQAAETGLVGFTRKSIRDKAGDNIKQIEVALDDLLSNSKEKIATLKIAPYLDELRATYAKIPGEEGAVEEINNIMRNFLKKKTLTPLEANGIKKAIYQNIDNSYGKGLLDVGIKTDAQKQIARGLKSEIEKIIPEAKSLNEKQAVYIQVKKALDKTIARTEGKGIAGTGIGMHDLLLGSTFGIPTGFSGGLGAIAVKKTLESPIVLSSASRLLNHINTLSPTKKMLIYEALKGLTVKSTSFSSGQSE